MDFGDDEEVIQDKKWNWKNFESTKDYPVSSNLLEWVIGQERALKECYLCLQEWVHKLKNLKKKSGMRHGKIQTKRNLKSRKLLLLDHTCFCWEILEQANH